MRFQPPRPKNEDERILPLINVVFLLLIFFMLAGRLAATDPLEITPPHSSSQAPAEARDLQVLVAADGRLALDSEVMDESAFEEAVKARLGQDDSLRVWLKADGRADAEHVVAVMEALRDAGVERLKLLTVSGGG